MALRQMVYQVHKELRPYPRSGRGSAQNLFRSVYQMARMNSMGRRAAFPNSAAAVREYALGVVRKQFPGFELIEA